MSNHEYDIFLTRGSADSRRVEELGRLLSARWSIRVCPAPPKLDIESGMSKSVVVGLCISNDRRSEGRQDKRQRREHEFTSMNNLKQIRPSLTVVSILLPEANAHDVPIEFRDSQVVDFSKGLADERELRRLVTTVVDALSGLGVRTREEGELAGARACLERALRLGEAAFGPDDPRFATVLNELGTVLLDLAGCGNKAIVWLVSVFCDVE